MLYSYKKGIPKELPETITVQETVFEEVTHDVVTDENGIEETITVTETLGRNVETVLSPPFTEEQLLKAGYVLATEPEHDPVRENCIWRNGKWLTVPSKKAIHREVKWMRIRNRRNYLLNTTDEIIRQHIEDNQQIPSEWVEYRNTLRNIPNVYETGEIDDVDLVVFPEMPHQFEQPLYKELYDKLNDENVIEALRNRRNHLYQNLLDVKWKQLRNIENQISDSDLDAQVQYLEDLIDENMKDVMTEASDSNEITQDV